MQKYILIMFYYDLWHDNHGGSFNIKRSSQLPILNWSKILHADFASFYCDFYFSAYVKSRIPTLIHVQKRYLVTLCKTSFHSSVNHSPLMISCMSSWLAMLNPLFSKGMVMMHMTCLLSMYSYSRKMAS